MTNTAYRTTNNQQRAFSMRENLIEVIRDVVDSSPANQAAEIVVNYTRGPQEIAHGLIARGVTVPGYEALEHLVANVDIEGVNQAYDRLPSALEELDNKELAQLVSELLDPMNDCTHGVQGILSELYQVTKFEKELEEVISNDYVTNISFLATE